jgi:hypothetical protein
MHGLLGITIFLLHGMHDKVSPLPPTSMHPQRIAILSSWEVGMAILQGCIEVGRGVTPCHASYEVGGW